MVEYNKINAKLSNSQLNKLKSTVKNNEETTLRISNKNVYKDYLPHELFLTQAQITKLRKKIENNMSADIKLSKAQIKNIIMSGGSLGSVLGRLLLALNNPLPVNKDAPKVPNNIGIIGKAPPLFKSFFSFFVTPFIKTSGSSKAFTILVILFMSSLENITVVLGPDPYIFLQIVASAADTAALNPKGANMFFPKKELYRAGQQIKKNH